MERPLRIEGAGGGNHVIDRGDFVGICFTGEMEHSRFSRLEIGEVRNEREPASEERLRRHAAKAKIDLE